MEKKPARLAIAVVIGVLTVLGAQSATTGGVVVADKQWCC